MFDLNNIPKELPEWDYMEEQKKQKEKEEEYIISSEKKFRARVLIITAVLCIAVIVLGIMYMNKIIDTSNAEVVDSSAAAETGQSDAVSPAPADGSSGESAGSASVTSAAAVTDELNADAETKTTSAAKDNMAEKKTEPEEDFTASAYADKSGLVVEWDYQNSDYKGKLISIYMTDGLDDYKPAGENLSVDEKKFSTSENKAENAVGLLIKITDSTDDVLLQRTIAVDNRTYEPEITYSDDIDIGELFR